MTDTDRLIAEVTAAAGGKIVGRVRLQKVFYLLDKMGLNSGFRYEYHHYGPYSADLSEAMADAIAFGFMGKTEPRRVSDGITYSIYTVRDCHIGEGAIRIGELDRTKVVTALAHMQSRSSLILELAATIHWLQHVESVSDWRLELHRRKGVKTEQGRADEALALLRDLGLQQR